MANTRFSDIVKYRRRMGQSVSSSVGGSVKDLLKEKMDPRSFLFNQKGLLTALFPSLRAFKAMNQQNIRGVSSRMTRLAGDSSLVELKPVLDSISINTKITAKNTMILPSLHRDVNVIRQNIVKLAKAEGIDAATKADMFFKSAKQREAAYESKFRREGGKTTPVGEEPRKDSPFSILSLLGIIGTIGKLVTSVLSFGKNIMGAFKWIGSAIKTTLGFLFRSVGSILLKTILPAIGRGLLKVLKFFMQPGFISGIIRSIATTLGPIMLKLFRFIGLPYLAYLTTRSAISFRELASTTELNLKKLPMTSWKKGEEIGPGIFAEKDFAGRSKEESRGVFKGDSSSFLKSEWMPYLKQGIMDVYSVNFPATGETVGFFNRGAGREFKIPLTLDEAQYVGRTSALINRIYEMRENEKDAARKELLTEKLVEQIEPLRQMLYTRYNESIKENWHAKSEMLENMKKEMDLKSYMSSKTFLDNMFNNLNTDVGNVGSMVSDAVSNFISTQPTPDLGKILGRDQETSGDMVKRLEQLKLPDIEPYNPGTGAVIEKATGDNRQISRTMSDSTGPQVAQNNMPINNKKSSLHTEVASVWDTDFMRNYVGVQV